MNAELSGARPKEIALAPDDVSNVEKLEQFEIAGRQQILLEVNLEALAALQQVRETGLPHAPDGLHPPGDTHLHAR